MTEQGGVGAGAGAGGGDPVLFSWENHSWAFTNSENSGRETLLDRKKQTNSSSNSPTIVSARPILADNPDAVIRKRDQQGNMRNSSDKNVKNNQWRSREDDPSSVLASKAAESDHEIHIWTERERRKKMRNMFSSLHSLLPQLPAKADKSTIVDEAVNYIKSLQQSLQNLQKQRLEMGQKPASSVDYDAAVGCETREAFIAHQVSAKSWAALNSPSTLSASRFPHCFQTWSSPNVVLSISGEDAQISVCTTRKPGLLTTIFCILEKYKLEVVTAHVSSDYFRSMFMIHTHANWVPDQFSEAVLIEDIYKLAVGEIIYWLSS